MRGVIFLLKLNKFDPYKYLRITFFFLHYTLLFQTVLKNLFSVSFIIIMPQNIPDIIAVLSNKKRYILISIERCETNEKEHDQYRCHAEQIPLTVYIAG
jgi:hypothetical protein